jgi:hypothetical protein
MRRIQLGFYCWKQILFGEKLTTVKEILVEAKRRFSFRKMAG